MNCERDPKHGLGRFYSNSSNYGPSVLVLCDRCRKEQLEEYDRRLTAWLVAMLSFIIAALVNCGPTFTEAPGDAGSSALTAPDGAIGIVEVDPSADSEAPRDAELEIDVLPEAVADAMTDGDSGSLEPDANHDADVERDATPDVDPSNGPPHCGSFGASTCIPWASSYCASANNACCRSDGVCGCKVTSGASCQ